MKNKKVKWIPLDLLLYDCLFFFIFLSCILNLDLYMLTSPRCHCLSHLSSFIFLRISETLKFYLNCKLTSWLAKVLWRLVEDMWSWVRDKGLYCPRHKHIISSSCFHYFPFPPRGPRKCCRVTRVDAEAQVYHALGKALNSFLMASKKQADICAGWSHSFYHLLYPPRQFTW